MKVSAHLRLDPAALERVKRRLEGAPRRFPAHRATVGIHEAEGVQAKVDYHGKPTDASLAEAAWGQEGQRQWLSSWFDQNVERFKLELRDAVRAEYSGDVDSMARLSKRWEQELQDWVAEEHGNLRSLSDATVKAKTAAGLHFPETPVFATGQLVRAIKARLDGAEL